MKKKTVTDLALKVKQLEVVNADLLKTIEQKNEILARMQANVRHSAVQIDTLEHNTKVLVQESTAFQQIALNLSGYLVALKNDSYENFQD